MILMLVGGPYLKCLPGGGRKTRCMDQTLLMTIIIYSTEDNLCGDVATSLKALKML